MKKQTRIIFYFLSVYVILQFAWWGFHLAELSFEKGIQTGIGARRMFMVIGEGMVFLLILIFGIIKMRKSILRDLELSRNQQNFLLTVTHELKTPIASTKLFLQTLQKQHVDENKRADILQKALGENARLEKMIDNILNASRLENRKLVLHTEEVDVSSFLHAIIDRFRKNNPNQLFEEHIQADLKRNIDPFVFETILNNLLDNAIKYGNNNPVRIEANADINLSIRIIDQGSGIPKDMHKSIFEKFVRVGNEQTRTQKGSGLGLFIAAEFTHLHRGQIKYRDNQPTGSIFELIL